MRNDPLKVGIQQLCKPTEVAVASGVAGVNDGGYLVGHTKFAITFVRIKQHFLNQICGKKKTVGYLSNRMIPVTVAVK